MKKLLIPVMFLAFLGYAGQTEQKEKAIECFNKGGTLVDLGRYEEALKSYDKAIELNPDDANAWYGKGIALVNLGRHEKSYDKALESLSKAIELDAKWKEEAKNEEDFRNLWDDEDFKRITK